jgi:hypothetical protein
MVAATEHEPRAQSVLGAIPGSVRSELVAELIAAGYAKLDDAGDIIVGDGDLNEVPPARPEPDSTGWAYAITDDFRSMVKIGTARDVATRLRGLQTASPRPLALLWQCRGGLALEMHLHEAFADRRVRGEWFDFTGMDAVPLITEAAQSFWDAQ